jgi:hypothetical protein
VHRAEGFPYVIDNGAWTAFKQGRPFDPDPFLRLLDKMGADADWVVVPDVVDGGLESLAMSVEWLPRLRGLRLMIPVQDRMEDADLAPLLSPDVGIFIGGTDAWKEATAARWAQLARRHGARCHMGRVNSIRRIIVASAAGCDSFDGSGPSRFSMELPKLDGARRQQSMSFLPEVLCGSV